MASTLTTDVRALWATLAGLDADNLTTADKSTFLRLANKWFRKGWTWAWWPDLIETEERTPDPTTFVVPPTESGKTEIGTVKEIYETDPRLGWAKPVNWERVKGGFLCRGEVPLTVWVEFLPPAPILTASTDETVPDFLANFIANAAYADWQRGEDQNSKAQAEEVEAGGILEDEWDTIRKQLPPTTVRLANLAST